MENQKVSFTDYLSILYKWKKLIIINFFLVSIFSVSLAFYITVTYKATATVMIPPSKDLGLGGLTNLLESGSSALGMGAKLLGVTNTNEDLLLGFLNSKAVLKKVVNEYDLFSYYEIEDENFDRLLEIFIGDLFFDPNEYGMIDISVVHEDPNICADMANYFVVLADSLNIYFNVQQSKTYRQFIEKKFYSILDNIKIAEEQYNKYQKEFGVFDVPEQVKVGITAIINLRAELIKKEILLSSLEDRLGNDSPTFIQMNSEINALQNKLKELHSGNDNTGVLLPLKDVPDLQLQYVRLYREMEIQNKLLEYMYPVYEQAKLDEQKSIPTLVVVDKAVPPQLKYAPKRAFIVLAITFLAFVIMLIFIFRAERILFNTSSYNLIEQKEKTLYYRILRLYRLIFSK